MNYNHVMLKAIPILPPITYENNRKAVASSYNYPDTPEGDSRYIERIEIEDKLSAKIDWILSEGFKFHHEDSCWFVFRKELPNNLYQNMNMLKPNVISTYITSGDTGLCEMSPYDMCDLFDDEPAKKLREIMLEYKRVMGKEISRRYIPPWADTNPGRLNRPRYKPLPECVRHLEGNIDNDYVD